jgi:hypothetical protein
MTLDKGTVKVLFGLLIFMFSLALAYFSASYVESEKIFDYWTMLVIFGGAYVIVGVLVLQVFPVSLGFLFAADVVILHLLLENFGDIPSIGKTGIIGIVLVLLYIFAWNKMKDDPNDVPPPAVSPPTSSNIFQPPPSV